MNRNLYYDLFKYLYDHYDINSGPALDNFAKTKVRESQKLIDIRDIKNMLNDLEKRGIATWKADKITTNQDGVTSYHWLDILRYKSDLGKDDNHTFENTRVEVHLTPTVGLEYVANILNREATLMTNKSMKTLTIVLVIIGAMTILLQVWQVCIASRQLKQSQPTSQSSTKDSATTLTKPIYNVGDSLNAVGNQTLDIANAKTCYSDTTAASVVGSRITEYQHIRRP